MNFTGKPLPNHIVFSLNFEWFSLIWEWFALNHFSYTFHSFSSDFHWLWTDFHSLPLTTKLTLRPAPMDLAQKPKSMSEIHYSLIFKWMAKWISHPIFTQYTWTSHYVKLCVNFTDPFTGKSVKSEFHLHHSRIHGLSFFFFFSLSASPVYYLIFYSTAEPP